MTHLFVQLTPDADIAVVGEETDYVNIHRTFWWALIHIDGIHDIFGPDVAAAVQRAAGQPVQITVTATVDA